MKKSFKAKPVIAAALICAGIAALTFALFSGAGARAGASHGSEEAPYVVTVVDGKLCVFSSENPEKPYISTEIEASRLRYVDYMEAAEGIGADDLEGALMLLEDFGS